MAKNLYETNMRQAQNTQIRNYNLFGEQGDLPDVVHCESVAARSQLHDWVLAPHRHRRLHQVLLLERGGGRASLDGRLYQLAPGSLVNVPIGCVHDYGFAPGSDGLVLTLASEILDETLHPGEGLATVLARPAVLVAPQDAQGAMRDIFAHYRNRSFGRARVLRALSALLLGHIAQAIAADGPGTLAQTPPDLLARFEALLEDHFPDRWRVADYAQALGVTPTHLTRIVRQATGRPATRAIEDRLIREARRQLVYTNITVSTLAYTLGFEDPAYFSRVFTRATGLSPRSFRARTGQGLQTDRVSGAQGKPAP